MSPALRIMPRAETRRRRINSQSRGLAVRIALLVLGVPILGTVWTARAAERVEVRPDIAYASSDHPRQTLDLYLPAERARDRLLPVVVFIHGGGWQNGSKASGKGWLEPYAASGEYAAVSIGYRLAGDARWPAQIHDCKAAIRWIRAHAAEHGLDPGRIGVAGSSAGGTLATLLGTSGGVPALEGEIGAHPRESSRVNCVVNLFGRMDFLAEPESARAAPAQAEALRGRLRLLFGGPLEEKSDLARAASPITHITPDDPPILTLHGTLDALVPFAQATRFDTAMRHQGRSHLLIYLNGFGHGFRNAEADRRARQFFDLHLRGQPGDILSTPIEAPERR